MINSRVIRGQFALTVGFKLYDTNANTHDFVSVSDLLRKLDCSKMSGVLKIQNNAIGVSELLPEWAVHLSDSEIEDEVSEYVSNEAYRTAAAHDDLSFRLFVKKTDLLTSKGRRGFATAKLLELDDLTLTELIPAKRDEGIRAHKRFLVDDHNSIVGVEQVTPSASAKPWKANLKVFLHLQLSTEDSNSELYSRVSPVAALSLILEPEVGNGSNDLLGFFDRTDRLNVDLKELAGKFALKDLAEEIGKASQYYIASDGMIPLLDFSIALSWALASRKARELKPEPIEANANKQFCRKLHELRNELTFEYREIVLDSLDEDPARTNIKTDSQWNAFVTRLLGFSTGLNSDQNAFVERKAVQLTPYTYFILNRGLYLMKETEHPEPQFHSHRLDYDEWGEKWGIAWAILMSAMLCLLAQKFILYNEQIESHVSEKKKSFQLREITEAAFQDFSAYYDVDMIQSYLYREEFESAKETFGINGYYDNLTRRLGLFAGHEAVAESMKLTRLWMRISIGLGILSGTIAIIGFLRAFL